MLLVAPSRSSRGPPIPAVCPVHDNSKRTTSQDPTHPHLPAEPSQQLELPHTRTHNCISTSLGAVLQRTDEIPMRLKCGLESGVTHAKSFPNEVFFITKWIVSYWLFILILPQRPFCVWILFSVRQHPFPSIYHNGSRTICHVFYVKLET